VLVAGIGNIFQSDDAFGVEVAGRLAGRSWPDGVRVEDFGIRGIHLAYELLEGYDTVVLVDAVAQGEAPGTVSVVEPDSIPGAGKPADPHSLDPAAVLSLLADLGGSVGRLFLVGCEPADIEDGMGLSPAVASAIDDAVRLVEELVDSACAHAGKE
jgi:hydrogenase maturation protease